MRVASACARWLVLAGVLMACGGKKSSAIAELKKMDGPVERQQGTGAWGGAPIGTKFFLGDAARTGDGGAQLEVVGNALIAMQPHTILRFGGTGKASKIAVELGTIELTGTGNYGFDIGDVRLSRNGTVRITANPGGKSRVELTLGEAQVSTIGGETIDLVVGTAVEIGLEVDVTPIDAGVPDAPPVDAAEPDAAAAAAGVLAEVTGKRAELLLAGATKWTALPPGSNTIPQGAKLRVGSGTTAKVTSQDTTLELAGGSRIAVADTLALAIEAGDTRAHTTGDATVTLPGGTVQLAGTPTAASEAKLAVGSRETRVTMTRGNAKLVGAPGSELSMNRGEAATLSKSGQLRVIEAIPGYFDFRLTVGESVTIHDPKPPTAIQFQFAGKCPSGGIIEMDRTSQYRTAKTSGGKEAANLLVSNGGWAYRLRCTSGGGEGSAVASGRVIVMRDDGRRALPKRPPLNSIDADGRSWRISYQSQIPNIQVHAKAPGSAFKLHLAEGGKEQSFDSKTASVTVSGSQLKEGQYTYWFEIDGVKQPKMSSLKIDFDQTAPQVYIEAPPNAKPWAGDIDVRGAVLPGWTAAVEGITIPIDGARRFAAKVPTPPGNALAIRLAHPQRGVHMYLRRAK